MKTEGDLPGLGPVPVDPNSLTNILSLGIMAKKYRVVMDSAIENTFTVFTDHGPVKFMCNDQMLYVHVPTKLLKSPSGVLPACPADPGVQPVRKQMHLQTVEENMKFYTPREVARAKTARDLLAALGTPSIADLKAAIAMNAIAGLPVTTKDVDLAEKIFGPDLGTLKGKTTRRKPLPLV